MIVKVFLHKRLRTKSAKLIRVNHGENMPYIGVAIIPFKNLAIDQLPVIVKEQRRLVVYRVLFDLKTMLIVMI